MEISIKIKYETKEGEHEITASEKTINDAIEWLGSAERMIEKELNNQPLDEFEEAELADDKSDVTDGPNVGEDDPAHYKNI